MRRHTFLLVALTVVAALVLTPGSLVLASNLPGPWTGEYFANPDLGGSPTLTRQDQAIYFDWGNGSPALDLPSDYFSVRWTRQEWFTGGTYRFLAATDDGVRIFVDGIVVLDEWHDRAAVWTSTDHYLAQGTHTVVVEYYERAGQAEASVDWRKVVGGEAWQAAYYDNQTMSGNPLLRRDEAAIDFDWGSGSPDPVVPDDDFSVRWDRTLGFTAGRYRFLASCDDGVRIFVDGQIVVDDWEKQSLPNTSTGEITLSEGLHHVVVEYFEEGGDASAHVWWERREPFLGWQGHYFDNPDLVGGPALARDDPVIDFDWGVGPPADWMPDDHFSVRWTRTVTFNPGYYIFYLQSDDGVRFWLDGALLINEWHPTDGELRYIDAIYLEGAHELKVEYYEQTGYASARFWWAPSTAWGIHPSTDGAVTAPGTGLPDDDPWYVEFFDNPDLSGSPVATRIDTSLDNDWGLGAPAAGVPVDGFSVRWTQPLPFQAGFYQFTTTTDDGVRLWVDGQLLIDAWRPMRSTRSATVWLDEGWHDVRMEYFERSGWAIAKLSWRQVIGSSGGEGTDPVQDFAAMLLEWMLGAPDDIVQP